MLDKYYRLYKYKIQTYKHKKLASGRTARVFKLKIIIELIMIVTYKINVKQYSVYPKMVMNSEFVK